MEKEEANERRQTKGVARDGASPARRRKQREECGVTSLMSYKNVISASVSSHPPTDLRVLLAYRGGGLVSKMETSSFKKIFKKRRKKMFQKKRSLDKWIDLVKTL